MSYFKRNSHFMFYNIEKSNDYDCFSRRELYLLLDSIKVYGEHSKDDLFIADPRGFSQVRL